MNQIDSENLNDRRYIPEETENKVKDGDIESEDENRSVLEYVKDNKLFAFILFILLVVLGAVVWAFSSLFATALRDWRFYAAFGSIIAAFSIFILGRRSYKASLKSKDVLDVNLGNTSVSYDGEFDKIQGNQVFYPVVDSSFFGNKRYLKVKDVSPKISNMKGVDDDPEDKMPIMIPNDISQEVDQDVFRKKMIANGSELSPLASGGIVRLQLKRPDTVDEESYKMLRKEYRKLEREYEALDYQLSTEEVERRRAENRARERHEQIEQDTHERLVELLEALQKPPSRSSDSEISIETGDNS